mgnify:CR=1 FL=1
MIQEIYIIDDKPDLRETLKRLFKEDRSYRFKSVPTESLDIALKNIPSLIIINEDNIDEDIISICQKIKKDDDNSITPVIVLSSNKNHTHRINLLKLVSHIHGTFSRVVWLNGWEQILKRRLFTMISEMDNIVQ